MSNPNLAPPLTISYELGFIYNFGINIIGTLSGYYKDATGQTGDVNYININGTIDYDRWQNNNYEDIVINVDIIINSLPLTPDTENILNERKLSLMNKNTVKFNK